MARESDGDSNSESVDEWVKNLSSRKVALEKEEKERGNSQPAVYRVDPSLRELKREHFEVSTLPLGLVHKIERPTHVADTLKLDVAIKFLSDLGKSPDDWRSISENVVPDPDAIKRIYNEYCRLSDDSIRSILAQDAIFLACFLIHFFRSLPSSTLRKTFDFFSGQSRRLRLVLLKDICKLENQITLELVKNVIMIVFQCQKSNLSEKDCQIKASETLEKICTRFVQSLSVRFPSFRFPKVHITGAEAKQADSTKIAAETIQKAYNDSEAEKTRLTDTQAEKTLEANSQAKGTAYARSVGLMLKQLGWKKTGHTDSKAAETGRSNDETLQLHQCQHLLHCVAEVLWSEAKVSDSKNRSRCQSLWDQHLPTAKELHKCGVQFQGYKDFHPKLVKDRFFPWRVTLFIPVVGAVDDDTEEMWRNLLAFEDAYMKQDERRSFMSYIQFMNDLISNEEDVRLLLEGKNPVIIASDLGDHKAVADMYNRVSKNHFRACNAEWSLIRRDVTKYYESSFKNGCMLMQPSLANQLLQPIIRCTHEKS